MATFTLDALGLGTQPPMPSLGGIGADQMQTLQQLGVLPLLGVLLLVLAVSGPCIFAGWVLLRPLRRAPALATALT